MTSSPTLDPNAALAAALIERLGAAAEVTVAGVRSGSLAQRLTSSRRRCTPWDGAADGTRFDAGVVVTEESLAPAWDLVRQVLSRVRPGGTLLWAVTHVRSVALARAVLHIAPGAPQPNPLDVDEAVAALQREGIEVAPPAAVDAHPEAWAGLEPVLDAVRQAGGDAQALSRDWSVSHHVVSACRPRRRTRRDDESETVLRASVEGALAAGAQVGRRSSGAVEGPAVHGRTVPPRVGVVVPVYNGASFTEKCLYAVAAHTGDDPDYEVIVVDNGSDDWTMYLLHAMEGDLKVLSNDRNLGFARACNQGAAASDADYLLFLNNDTVPRDGWLASMVRLADSDDQIGVVGAKLLSPDGTVQHAGLHMVGGVPDHEFRGVSADDVRVSAQRDLDMVTGACLLIRRSLFERLGGFDSHYVNGVEDVDLCLRARELGYRVVYCPEAVVEHHEARTEGRFDHVQENVQRFHERWRDRFDGAGRLRVDGAPTEADGTGQPRLAVAALPGTQESSVWVGSGRTPSAASVRVTWEGSFFLHSSLAHVNRELVLALIASSRCEIGLLPFEPDQFGVEEDERFEALTRRMNTPQADADVHVRHRWPPDFSRPAQGRYALMQPWEFGSIPRDWLAALQSGVVDHVWAYSGYVRDCYVDSGVDPDRVAVVPAGVDPDRFRPGLPALELVRSERSFRFLFVGGTLYRKGIDVLLAAYREAFAADEDVSLVIKDMGVGTFYRNQTAGDRIRQLQADPGCAEIVYLTDDLPGRDMPRLYAAADALVHPYRGEGFGLPVAEAMACGLPVIVTRGGACDDFCPEHIVYPVSSRRLPMQLAGQETVGQAWQLEPDAESLKQQLRAMYEDRATASDRGLAGSHHVRSHVTWEVAAKAALEAIERLRDAPPVSSAAPPAVAAPASPAPKTAVVILGQRVGDSRDGALAEALGPYHRFHVDTTSGHHLGEQIDAVYAGAGQAGVERLFLLAPDVEANVEDIRRLADHLDRIEGLAVVAPASTGSAPGEQDLVDCEYPDASCLMFRQSALADVGGFDTTFVSSAVFSNAARCLRRKGWRVAVASDVLLEDGDCAPAIGRPPARLLSLGHGAGGSEARAVEEMEAGDRLRDAGEAREAIACYRRCLEHKSDFVEAILVLADASLEAGLGDDALATVRRLVEIDPKSSSAHNYAGLVSARAGDTPGAREHFRRAIEIDPGLVEARVNLGVVEWESRDLEAALEQFREASRLDPLNRELVCNLGLIYSQVDDDEAAVTLFRGYLERCGDDVEILGRLADVLIRKQDVAAARDVARQILRLAPDHARAQAILEDDLGEDEAAQG